MGVNSRTGALGNFFPFFNFRLETALQNIANGMLHVENYEFTILHLGTNNVTRLLPREFNDKFRELTKAIIQKNRYTTIGISSILPRPKDTYEQDEYRRGINSSVKKMCRDQGFQFLRSWTSVESVKGLVKDGVYAEDDLHLNHNGIIAMKQYMEGALGGMMEVKYRME